MPTRLAVSINAVPTKLARAINLLAEGDENKDLKVGDVFPKAAAAPEGVVTASVTDDMMLMS